MATYDFFADRRVTPLARWLWEVLARRLQREIAISCPQAHDVVEIGTGLGILAGHLRAAGFDYVGYEPNKAMVERAKNAGFKMRNALVPPLQEPDGSCDVIVMSHVFEHMAGISQAQEFLSEARRCLRPGGILILLSPDLLDFGTDFWNVDYTHTFPTSLHRVRQMLPDAGLEPVRSAFIYGSLPYFPGYFINLAFKLGLTLLHPVWECVYPRYPRFYKLRTTFSRSFLVVARKAS